MRVAPEKPARRAPPDRPLNEEDRPRHPVPLSNSSSSSRLVNGDSSSRSNSIRRRRAEAPQNDWSENILAEFNSIIANEINELTKATEERQHRRDQDKKPKPRYRELLTELGISNTDSSSSSSSFEEHTSKSRTKERKNETAKDKTSSSRHQHMLNSDYDEPRDQIRPQQRKRISGSLPGDGLRDATNSDYDEPANCLLDTELLRIKQNSSSLPSGFDAQQRYINALPKSSSNSLDKQQQFRQPRPEDRSKMWQVKPSTDPMPRSNRMFRAFAKASKASSSEDARAQLPPQPFQRKSSLPNNSLVACQKKRTLTTNHYGKIQKARSGNADPDYEEIREPHMYEVIGKSKSLENNAARSAPSTPTEVKRTPFSRLLRRQKHTPIYRDSSADAVLVRVSSLPDQDLVNISNDHRDEARKAMTTPVKDMDSLKKKRAISPLTWKSDITAKRLSESDKDVTQISPVELRRFQVGKQSNGNDVAVSCDFPEAERSEVDGNVSSDYAVPEKVQENGDVKALVEEQNSRLVSVSNFF